MIREVIVSETQKFKGHAMQFALAYMPNPFLSINTAPAKPRKAAKARKVSRRANVKA